MQRQHDHCCCTHSRTPKTKRKPVKRPDPVQRFVLKAMSVTEKTIREVVKALPK